ncbi:MAG: hypothetical protein KDA27_26110 [Candidatus Eisenbacteria bacterium]|uniref:FlgD/Vpr Ig-like domain-containing protein n=1 Tax=Eiseniibacteriota bacterium TaxID=2212470 RepID=A0A956NHY5_UNCEI|nr:hypothetical protein [Candidatus Eisenbacteria bacterium]
MSCPSRTPNDFRSAEPSAQPDALRRSAKRLLLLVSLLVAPHAASAAPEGLPLLHLEDMVYEGAFRLPDDTFGISSLNYAEGPIAYDAESNSIFIVGHAYEQAIAEFSVPPLVLSATLADLNMAGAPDQTFATVLDRTSGGNPQELDRIGGMAVIDVGAEGEFLLINAYEYYDAPADNSETTAVLQTPGDLAGSDVIGFHTFEGGAGHTSGWISPIPPEWQADLGGSHLTGQSSGLPIIGRLSVGPSAFAFDPTPFLSGTPGTVPTTRLLDFSLEHPLHPDLMNDSRENDLWTHMSRVVYGLIVPGTRTYATFGHSGGHESGVCYKCVQTNGDGSECGGYCPRDANDYALYYWLWDVEDLLAVKNGEIESYDVRPYEYGVLPALFPTIELGGGAFDPTSGLLYLTLQRADSEQGTYSNPPVVVAYSFPVVSGLPDTAGSRSRIRSVPNPLGDSTTFEYSVARERSRVALRIFDSGGRLVRELIDAEQSEGPHSVNWTRRDETGAEVPAGVYHVRLQVDGESTHHKLIVLD